MANAITVMVVYALANQQEVLSIDVAVNSSVDEAIQASGILHKFEEIDLAKNKVGIFGKIVELDQILHDQDRVEIYRPLMVDPMQARRKRADLQG